MDKSVKHGNQAVEQCCTLGGVSVQFERRCSDKVSLVP
jgi:hypothetical protein